MLGALTGYQGYQPQTFGLVNPAGANLTGSAGVLAGMAPNVPQVDYGMMMNKLGSGQLLSGQRIPQYQAPTSTNFAYSPATPGGYASQGGTQRQPAAGNKGAQANQASKYTPPQGYMPAQYNTGRATQFQNPQYQAVNYNSVGYNPYQFSTQNIADVPQQAYGNALQNNLDMLQKQMGTLQAQASSGMAGRGFGGNSGALQAENTSLGRDAMDQGAQMASQYGLQQAQSQLQNAQFMAGQNAQMQQNQAAENQFGANFASGQNQFGANFASGQNQFQTALNQWLQQQQAAENLSRSQLGLQGQEASEASRQFGATLQNQEQQQTAANRLAMAQQSLAAQTGLSQTQLQQMGALGTLGQQASAQAMQPYNTLASLYGQNTGINVPSGGGGGKGSPLSALLGAGGQIGSAVASKGATSVL